ncbi:MAG TPA: hypothetical protein VIT44_12965, partial [Cyclobacteriaceae bacterium]
MNTASEKNRKRLTLVLIGLLLADVVFQSAVIFDTTRLWYLISEFILSGNLFQAHILSHQSSFFWFNLIDTLIPCIFVLSILIGAFSYFRSDTTLSKYLILGIILNHFPTMATLLLISTGLTKYSIVEYFSYNSVWSLLRGILYYVGFVYTMVYFCLFNVTSQGNVPVSGNIGIRFKNYLIDTLYVGFCSLALLQLFATVEITYFLPLYLCTSTLYYLYSEALFSQSIGKILTGTSVSFRGNRFTGSLIRTLSRRIPLEPLSFFLKESSGRWHDNLS